MPHIGRCTLRPYGDGGTPLRCGGGIRLELLIEARMDA